MAALSVSDIGSLDDHAPLHLPIPGLFADIEAGSGSVALTEEFHDASPKLRIEVLQQWMRAPQREREAALVEMFREFAAPFPGLTIVEQIDRFRQLCACRGVECPPELPVLLQRF